MLFSLFAATVLLSCHAVFHQDRFVISFWVDPIVPTNEFLFEYTRIASANFTAVLGGFGATDPASVTASIATCAALDLVCIPSACETAPDAPGPSGSCVGLPGAWGFQLKDEPSASDFPALRIWADSVSQRSPDALRFINLLPNYANTVQWGTGDYESYVTSFINIVHPDILCFDAYPIFSQIQPFPFDDPSNETQAGYLRNLATIRTAALNANLPFWNFFNSMPYGGRSDLTEAQMKWQVFTALAHGSKGALYFCYWTPTGTTFEYANAIITRRAVWGAPETAPIIYVPGPHFEHAHTINTKLRNFGQQLFYSNSTNIEYARSNSSAVIINVDGNDINSISGSGCGTGFDTVIGLFDMSNSSSRGVLIVNNDVTTPTLYTLGLVTPNATILEDGAPIYDDAPDIVGLQIYIEAGDARLLIFPQ